MKNDVFTAHLLTAKIHEVLSIKLHKTLLEDVVPEREKHLITAGGNIKHLIISSTSSSKDHRIIFRSEETHREEEEREEEEDKKVKRQRQLFKREEIRGQAKRRRRSRPAGADP